MKPKKSNNQKEITNEKIEEENLVETQSADKNEGQKDESEESDKDFAEVEDNVLKAIKEIEGDDGAAWDTITESCEKQGLDKNTIEEALTSLMDKGLIYEPVLGTIKTT